MSIKIKKLLAVSAAAAMTFSVFSGCKRTPQNVTLTLSAPQDEKASLEQMAESFKSAHKDNNYTINLKYIDEDAAISKNANDTGDVFAFKSGQLGQMHNKGALLKVTDDTDKIKTSNLPDSVAAATVNGILYAYPSSNSTYLLYYSKKYFSPKDINTIEGILNKQLPDGVSNLAVNLLNGESCSIFFLTGGCQLFGADGTDSKKCTYNGSNAVNVGNYLINIESQRPKFIDYENYDSSVAQNFKSQELAACISDLSNANQIKNALGSNFAAAKLPTVNINGKNRQMVSYADYTLYGVNSHTKNPKAAKELAEFITNSENQKLRFEKNGAAPVNISLESNKAVLSDTAVLADFRQLRFSKNTPSASTKNDFWAPIGNFGALIVNNKINSDKMQKSLDAMAKSMIS